MAYFDLPLEELWEYKPERSEPIDFDEFWDQTLTESHELQAEPNFTPAHPELTSLEVFDVTFSGFGGDPIKAWLILPRHRTGPLPTVVEFIGYGSGRGLPSQWLLWASAGYAHFVMDTRGQGSVWIVGDTPDPDPDPSGPQHPGFLTRGILDPATYYYRRVFTDAVLAVECVRGHPAVDADRVIVSGGSQGGGIALAATALAESVSAALVDVPFLCHINRAIEITDNHPYNELRWFLSVHRDRGDQVFKTLGYFDGLNMAIRAEAPTLMSVGLMDEICPPSTVFAAYNHYAGPKEIEVWPYNSHDAGKAHHVHKQFDFLAELGITPDHPSPKETS